ncbi:MAG: cation transporter [Bacteroidetes bacterium]|nr:cation transporter [Bacteroidota bacterium]MCH8169685.1 cation transporter [Bacteroidota bacterium]MCH8942930.1 cation transporter [Bacteroidota bacterium]
MTDNKKKLVNIAILLAFITITYNAIEGIISVYFGTSDNTLALLGFGVDSFVEVISGIGIAHMVLRMKFEEVVNRDKLEIISLRITGTSFYLLTAGLIFGGTINIIENSSPETTVVGIIIALISLFTMYLLIKYKLLVGNKLNSAAIIADANCTKTCFNLSIVLLVSSGLYEIFKINYFDVLGSFVIAYFAFKEGKEAFEKAKSEKINPSCNC